MSKPVVATKQAGLLQFPGILHFTVILVISVIEIVGLVTWLRLHTGEALTSVLGPFAVPQLQQLMSQIGRTAFAGVILGIFLLVEHVITQVDQTGKFSAREFAQIFVFSVIEVLIWIVWLVLIPINGIIAFVFFFGSLFVEHQIADNVKKGLGFLHFSSRGSRVFLGLIVFTIAEVVGAVVWVAAASILALAIGSIVEHYIARNVGQIRE
ncbi:MAG TPA: hypothetical protein VIH34_00965 [Candidatus Bathyarchaeia archaeon]